MNHTKGRQNSSMNIPEQSIYHLRPTIIYCLDHDLLPTAEFTAERLVAQNPNNIDSIYIYALTLFKQNKYKSVYNTTSPYATEHVGCSYLFASACLHLNLETDGTKALTKTSQLWTALTPNGEYDRYQPDAITCCMLLAKLYSKTGDVQRSSVYYAEVLKLNPYIFEAFEALCKMGVKVKVNSIYKVNQLDDISNPLFKTNNQTDDKKSGFGFGFGDYNKKESSKGGSVTPARSNTLGTINGSPDPQQTATFMVTPRIKQAQVPDAPLRRTTRNSGYDNFKQPSLPTDSIIRKKNRSSSSITSRLLNHPLNTLSAQNVNPNTTSGPGLKKEPSGVKRMINSTFGNGSAANPNNNNPLSGPLTERPENILKSMNDEYLVSIYSKLAKGYKAMMSYDCFKAIRIFDSLPENERNTPWVLSKLGRLHFEIVNYEQAEIYFVKLRELDRTRIADMEYYSTLLWHLHKEIELSYLCHELHEINRDSPESWIAAGNLYSLKHEPDEAIKCFQRAITQDKTCVYAYTLKGHEYLANDAFENALDCFRHAISLDPRHYNAFYGIGMVYLKMGDFRKSEFHFRKAVEINPVNVILLCCVGMVLEKLGKKDQALRQYIFASKLQPLSMLALFKKAQSLFYSEQYDLALKDFEKLENLAPDEASVHFLLGKLYKIYDRKNEAIKQFTIALNLDPKGSHLIKEALENLSVENEYYANKEN